MLLFIFAKNRNNFTLNVTIPENVEIPHIFDPFLNEKNQPIAYINDSTNKILVQLARSVSKTDKQCFKLKHALRTLHSCLQNELTLTF